MKIAFDCRYLGKSGIGRVNAGMIDALDFSENEFYLIGSAQKLAKYEGKAHIVADETDPFSAHGLFSFDKKLNGICDALVVPNFIIPFGVKIPVYTVMHDLMFLDVKELIKSPADKFVKKTLIERTVKKSAKIFCVSEFTYNRCRHYYPKYGDKFDVCREGFKINIGKDFKPYEHKEKELVYVGNVKPHKGLKTLVEAYKMLPAGEYKLKIIGEKDNFRTGANIEELSADGVIFTGRLSDEALYDEVAKSEFLVQPSFYEGFGIPPLEALCLGTKPIVSDIEVFREVYDGFDVQYFKAGDAKDLARKILTTDPVPKTAREEIEKRYDYSVMTEKILREIKG